MTAAATITTPQLRRLQVLYKQYEAHSLDTGGRRNDRLEWASARVGRAIASFSELRLLEARTLIDGLQSALGTKVPAKKTAAIQRAAERAGTEGRRDQRHAESTMVSPADIARIQRELTRLGWNQARLEAFLAGPRGPNHRRTAIRTLGDANRAYWALKRMQPEAPDETQLATG